jgi:hypothetical protein
LTKYSYPGIDDKPKVSWRLLAGIGVAALALSWWYFRPAKQAGASSDQSGQISSAPASAAAGVSTAPPGASAGPDHDELLASLRQKLSGSVDEALAALAELANTQPELAINLANELGRTNQEKFDWVQRIVKQWANRDSEQAWNWIARPNNSLANLGSVATVMDAMAASNPDMLLGHIDALLVQDDKSGSLFTAQNAVYYGLDALIKSGNLEVAQATVEAWANDPNKLPIGTAAFEIVALAMNPNSPSAAAAWLRSLPASDDRNSAIQTFVYQWGQNNPVAAMTLAQTLTPQEGQTDAVGRVFNEWIQSDPTKAMNWLEDYLSRTPDNIADDLMIGSLVLFAPAVKNDPNEAMKLADSISNPQARSTYQQQIIQSWARSDPAAPIEYLLKNPNLDPDQKKLLIQEAQEAGSPSQGEQ